MQSEVKIFHIDRLVPRHSRHAKIRPHDQHLLEEAPFARTVNRGRLVALYAGRANHAGASRALRVAIKF